MKNIILSIVLFFIGHIVNAQSWTDIGGMIPGVSLYNSFAFQGSLSICSNSSGEIFAVGELTDGSGKYCIVKWDGANWTILGGTVSGTALNANGVITSLISDVLGNIYAGGSFTDANGKYYVAKWDGTKWFELGGTAPGIGLNANGEIISLTSDVLGNIYAGGYFTDGGGISAGNQYVAKWDGTKWLDLGGTIPGIALNVSFGTIGPICSDTLGNIYAAGTNDDLGGFGGDNFVAKWNGTQWIEIPGNFGNNGTIQAICSDLSGNIYIAGGYTDANGNNSVTKWDGTSWIILGGTVPGVALNANSIINTLISDTLGNIYAAGGFTDVNGKKYVAKWDGTKWFELGGTATGVALNANGLINSICLDTSGNVYAIGAFTDANGNSFVAKFGKTNSVTDIANEKLISDGISIYPNPTNGNISIKVLDAEIVNIYNPLGDLVVVKSIEAGITTISLEEFKPGLYTVLFNGKASSAFKVIKE